MLNPAPNPKIVYDYYVAGIDFWINPVGGVLYSRIDVFYPNGWTGFLSDYGKTTLERQKINGPSWRIVPSNK